MGGGHVWRGGMRGSGGACVAGVCVGGYAWRGACIPRMPPQTPRDTVGQCAGSTHPIGMHSCFKYNDKS